MSIQVGDRVVVYRYGHDFPIKVKSIQQEPTGNTRIILDWGDFGESRVWLHDEGKTWHLHASVS